jgi:hypothetical protein
VQHILTALELAETEEEGFTVVMKTLYRLIMGKRVCRRSMLRKICAYQHTWEGYRVEGDLLATCKLTESIRAISSELIF